MTVVPMWCRLPVIALSGVCTTCLAVGCAKEDGATPQERCAELLEQARAAATVPAGAPSADGVAQLIRRSDALADELAAHGRIGASAIHNEIKVQGPGRARAYLIGMLPRFDSDDIETAVRDMAATLDLSIGELTVLSSLLVNYDEPWARELALEWSLAVDDRVRLNATASLCRFRDPRCSSRLRDLLRTDKSARVRRNAAAMGTNGAVTGQQDELVSLCEATVDPDPGVRQAALQSIQSIVEPGALPTGLTSGDCDCRAWYGQTGHRLVWDSGAAIFRAPRTDKR